MISRRFYVPEPARDLGAEMNAFDQSEHQKRVVEENDRKRALAAIARDASRSLVERVEAVIAGLGLSRVLWANVTTTGAIVHPCDGKHVNTNRRAVGWLLEALPTYGLAGAVAGQDIAVTLAPPGPPSSGRRPLLAGDKTYQELRWAALAAFDELVRGLGAGVMQISGPPLSLETRRELSDLADDLSIATHEPRKGAVPRVAVACAQKARDVAVEQPALEKAAWAAAKTCKALAEYADEWAIQQARGGA